jgi:hypothetical protein
MKNEIFYILPVLMFIYCCRTYNPQSKKNAFEYEKVERCRKNWTFSNFHDTLEISLLKEERKGSYDMVSWPNFFIGISSSGDTLGVVEYDTEKTFKKRDIIRFLTTSKDTSILAVLDNRWDEPVFRVSKRSKENDLYCSVKTIYYGKLLEE